MNELVLALLLAGLGFLAASELPVGRVVLGFVIASVVCCAVGLLLLLAT